jgi:hypothetical protein
MDEIRHVSASPTAKIVLRIARDIDFDRGAASKRNRPHRCKHIEQRGLVAFAKDAVLFFELIRQLVALEQEVHVAEMEWLIRRFEDGNDHRERRRNHCEIEENRKLRSAQHEGSWQTTASMIVELPRQSNM